MCISIGYAVIISYVLKAFFQSVTGDLWYNAGRFLYVLCALVLCLVALFMKVAF